MSTIHTPAGRTFRTVDFVTNDMHRTRRDVIRAGGRIVSSCPAGAGYMVRAAYPVGGAA